MSFKFLIIWRLYIAKVALLITSVKQLQKELLPGYLLYFSSLNIYTNELINIIVMSNSSGFTISFTNNSTSDFTINSTISSISSSIIGSINDSTNDSTSGLTNGSTSDSTNNSTGGFISNLITGLTNSFTICSNSNESSRNTKLASTNSNYYPLK